MEAKVDKLIYIVSIVLIAISCNKADKFPETGFDINKVNQIDVQDTSVKNFFIQFIRKDSKPTGVYTIHTSSDFLDSKSFVIHKTYLQKEDTIRRPPLFYTLVEDNILFFETGLEYLFQSELRIQNYKELVRNIKIESGVLHCGDPVGVFQSCGENLKNKIFERPFDTSNCNACLHIENIKFLPPEKPNK